jgi:HK97 family phage portal protein
MKVFSFFNGWRGLWGAFGQPGEGGQVVAPMATVAEDVGPPSPDRAMQIATVWRCVELLSKIISTLPFFTYERLENGQRDLARTALLYSLLHDSPNSRMTPAEFWSVLIANWLLRGNGYARIDRAGPNGEAVALWPMPADQVLPYLMDTGELVYLYQIGAEQVVLPADRVLHLKGIGNGIVGLSRLDFMRMSMAEAERAQAQATRTFKNGNKPAGLLTIEKVLTDQQRASIRKNFADIANSGESRLHVLEAGMKFEQVQLTPEQVQLMDSRRLSIEELCRWFGVPPVLVGHSNVTAWGTGIEQIIEGFYKLTVRPMLIDIEQAVTKRVLTPTQRARFSVEFSFDALLRSNLKDRLEVYAKAVQNGVYTRNECRQLENLPPMAGGDTLTAQTNLVPIEMLGKVPASGGSNAAQEVPQAQ